MLLKIVVGRKDIGADEFLLEDIHEVKQVLGTVVADIIHLVGRNGKTILAIGLLGSMLHDPDNTLDDVIDVGEVALALAKVEDLDGFASTQLVGETKIGHIRASGRAIDRKEAETGGGDIIKLGIGMGKQLVALLGGRIERNGIIHLVVRTIGNLLVRTIDRARRCINQMIHMMMTTTFEDIIEPDEVRLDVGIGIGNRVTHACLCSQIHHYRRLVFGEEVIEQLLVSNVSLDKFPILLPFVLAGMKLGRQVIQLLETLELDVHVVVVVEAIDTNNPNIGHVVEQTPDEIGPDETCRTRHQYRFTL